MAKPNIRVLDDLTDLEKLSLQSYSYSRLNAFDWCQSQFFYNYIIKIPQEFSPKALLGNMIHMALEFSIRDGEPINRAELIENYYDARGHYDPDETVVSDELFEEGFPMLEDFLSREGNSLQKVTKSELYFEFVFYGTLLRGYIDQVYVGQEEVTIKDFKSGNWEVANKNVPFDLQLGIYALYMKYLHPDKVITAQLHYLKSNKIKEHTFSDEDLVDVEKRLAKTIDGVRNTKYFKTLPKKLAWKCNMCSYQKDGTCKAGRFNVESKERDGNRLIGPAMDYS